MTKTNELTADTISCDHIIAFRDSLPDVTDEEFRSGGAPYSQARWRRVCHVALNVSNAVLERGLIADALNARASRS